MFAGIPFSLQKKPSEADYHRMLHLFSYLVGLQPHSEIMTNKGIIDMVIETRNRITIFELKFNKTAKEALEQIKDKQYYKRYIAGNKPITLVGLSFDLNDKDLTIDWVQEDIGS